jgi:hypothetical protein
MTVKHRKFKARSLIAHLYSRLAFRTPNRPQARWTFTATCARGLATLSPTSRSSIPCLLPVFVPQPAPPAMPLLFGMPTSAGTAMRTTTAPDMYSARSHLKPWGGSVPGPSNSSAKPPTPLSPNRGNNVPSASPMCTARRPWCSAILRRDVQTLCIDTCIMCYDYKIHKLYTKPACEMTLYMVLCMKI